MISLRSVSACSVRLFASLAFATSSSCAACVSLVLTGEAGARTGGFSSFAFASAALLPDADATGFCVALPLACVVGATGFAGGATGSVTGGGAGTGADAVASGVGSAGVEGGVAEAVAASTGGVAGGGVAAAV